MAIEINLASCTRAGLSLSGLMPPVGEFGGNGVSKIVQENFGDAIISAVEAFAKNDLQTVDQIENAQFSHVGDPQLRRALAETFYGARWIYKLGLALLVKNEEQMAHVRAQILDYGAVCEGLLSDCILHALNGGHMNGTKYQYRDTVNLNNGINWNVQDKLRQLTKQSFHWHIEVAQEELIISAAAAARLHGMRRERNTIHLRERTYRAFIGTSKTLFGTANEVITATKAWKQAHP